MSRIRFRDARTQYNQHGEQTTLSVSKATGITHSLLEDLEHSDRNVGYKRIADLAKYYGVSCDYLMGLTDSPKMSEEVKTVESNFGLSHKAASELVTLHGNYQRRVAALSALMEQDEFRGILDAIDFCVRFGEWSTYFEQTLKNHDELPKSEEGKTTTEEILVRKDRAAYRTAAIYEPQYLIGKIAERLIRASEKKAKRREAEKNGNGHEEADEGR